MFIYNIFDIINFKIGLYTSNRGPHSYWLKSQQSLPPDDGSVINLINYEDAAKASIKVLENG